MNKPLLVPILIGFTTIAIFIFVSATLTSVWVFIPGVLLTFVVYLKTYYKKVAGPERILPYYLLLLGIQFLHFTEEYLTDFTKALPELMGQDEYPMDYWIVFNMVAYFIFIIGGIILFKKMKEFMIIPLFFIVVGVLLNSVAHILLSIYVGGYFSGLYTSLIYVIIGPLLIKMILEETNPSMNKVTS